MAQLLLPRADKHGRVMATEVLVITTAVPSIIDLAKLQSIIQTGRK